MSDYPIKKHRTAVEYITASLLGDLCAEAMTNQRGRINHNFHALGDGYQRLLNVIQPNSYIQPHRHLSPPKSESFIVLKGKIAFFCFDANGSLTEARCLGPAEETIGVDIHPGIWHTFLAIGPDTVVFEGKNGPYNPATDKAFASWAPTEGSPEAEGYMRELLSQLPQPDSK